MDVEDFEMQEEPEMEEDTVSHSYMEFTCDNSGQDAVSKIRAARKSQDNKYISRSLKKEE